MIKNNKNNKSNNPCQHIITEGIKWEINYTKMFTSKSN